MTNSPPTSPSRASPDPRMKAPGSLLPLVLAAQMVIPFSIAGAAVALPSISREFGTDTTGLQWVVNGFNVAFALFTLLWGAVADRLGVRFVFRAGILLGFAGSVVSALAPSLLWLDLARTVAGIGAAAVLVSSVTMLTLAYRGAAQVQAFALFGSVNGLGLVAGPTVSGLLAAGQGWRSVFAAYGLFLGVALVSALRLPRFAPTGRQNGRLLDLSALRIPRFSAMLLVPIAGAIGFVTLLTYLPTALQAVLGWGPGQSGAAMLIATVPALAGPWLTHRIMKAGRLTAASVSLLALLCLILAALGLLLLRPNLPFAVIIAPMILAGLGFGLPLGIVDGEALATVPPAQAGSAAGLLNFFRIGSEATVVGAYSAALSAIIAMRLPPAQAAATAAGQPGHGNDYADALAPVFISVAILVAIIAATMRLLLHREPASRQPVQ